MTDKEKQEFEEFLEWKRQKAAKKHVVSDNAHITDVHSNKVPHQDRSVLPTDKTKINSKKKISNLALVVYGIIALLLIISIIYTIGKENKNDDSVAAGDTRSAVAEKVDKKPEPVKAVWAFDSKIDAMTNTKNIWAKISSDDFISQDFPYQGLTFATITVRYMKKYGYDVLIEITKGQIYGNEYNGSNYINAMFDGAGPKKYYFSEPEDGSVNVVFIKSKSDFISKCKKAKDIKIEIPIYQSGRPVFSFHVDEPLVWPE